MTRPSLLILVLLFCLSSSQEIFSFGKYHERLGRIDDEDSQTLGSFQYSNSTCPIIKITTTEDRSIAQHRTGAAVTSCGDLLLWGDDRSNRDFFFDRTSNYAIPSPVFHVPEPVIDVALTSTPTVLCLAVGESGTVYNISYHTVSTVPLPEPITTISAGREHVLYLSSYGTLFGSSERDVGCRSLGLGPSYSSCSGRLTPPVIISWFWDHGIDIKMIHASNLASFVVSQDNELYAFGRGPIGRLSSLDYLEYPERIFGGINGRNIFKISVNEHLGTLLLDDGTVLTWHSFRTTHDGYRNLGRSVPNFDMIPSSQSFSDPVQPFELNFGSSVVDVASSGCGGFLLTLDGDVYNWGSSNCLHGSFSQAQVEPARLSLSRKFHNLVGVDQGIFLIHSTDGEADIASSPGHHSDQVLFPPTTLSETKNSTSQIFSWGGPLASPVANIGRYAGRWRYLFAESGGVYPLPIDVDQKVEFVQLAINRFITFAVDSNSQLWSWGQDRSDATNHLLQRDLDLFPIHQPVLCSFDSFDNKDIAHVAVNYGTSTSRRFIYLVFNDGSVVSWGQGSDVTSEPHVYLGHHSPHSISPSQSSVFDSLFITKIHCSKGVVYVLDDKGVVYSFGRGLLGRKDRSGGYSTTSQDHVARPLENLHSSVLDIQCGDSACLFLNKNGYLYSFGSRSFIGREGSSLETNSMYAPHAIPGRFHAFSCSGNVYMAITSDLYAVSWGRHRSDLGRDGTAGDVLPIVLPDNDRVDGVVANDAGGFVFANGQVYSFGDRFTTGLAREATGMPQYFKIWGIDSVAKIFAGSDKNYLVTGSFAGQEPWAEFVISNTGDLLMYGLIILVVVVLLLSIIVMKREAITQWLIDHGIHNTKPQRKAAGEPLTVNHVSAPPPPVDVQIYNPYYGNSYNNGNQMVPPPIAPGSAPPVYHPESNGPPAHQVPSYQY
ncbi:hypothetical protein P9112_009841 [Eukaryota sp. TZLM1-RC]